MKNSLIRYATAVVVVPFVYLLITRGPAWGFDIVVTGAFLLALWEWLAVLDKIYSNIPKFLGICTGASILATGFFPWLNKIDYVPFLIFILAFLGSALFRILNGEKDMVKCAGAFSGMFAGILIVSLAGLALMGIRSLPGGRDLILYVLSVVWLGDTGAMHFGRRFGRRRLTPVISPNKTVEGFIGALVSGCIGAAVYLFLFNSTLTLSWIHALAVAPILVIASHIGDLTISIFKRAADIKDSGTLIPGHGGFLDRLDNLLLSAPVMFVVALVLR